MITCDKCKKKFNPEVRTWHVGEDGKNVEEVFFNCPRCNERYTAYYLNEYIKDKQVKLRKLNKERTKLQADMENEMNRLHKEYKR